ncbi:dTMP kinase [Aliiglaciecola sp. CAU 1673]|uniref:dTMP kinase n=1 Tax=Aliiglaciecola sp. CAU 1673 TaxID=3032595 RepID=UPI0023D98039|nr:dTMP kinase [Aliiglaciecola sp. CAU 1673]MDF2177635.1 dTMP kinase [Aliiglaciecola sp. CAU 1673]
MSGKFIVIEGLEGAGKSSAIEVVRQHIAAAGHQVVCTREPGGTPMAEAIRECVKQPWDEKVTIEAELLLMYAARCQLLENVIKPGLAQGKWVIGDRHDLSSRAYQGGGRQLSDSLLDAIRAISLKGFTPDLTLYLDIDPALGLARARGRGALDRIEQENLGFFERTRAKYLALANGDKHIRIVDAAQSMDKVQEDIIAIVDEFLR